MTRTGRIFVRIILLSTCLSAAGTAMAQEASTGDAAAKPAPLADTNDGAIVVTAQKRAQSILDVPISMAAISSDTLTKSEITTLGGLQNLVPNFQVSDNVSVRTVYIRGVGGGGRTVAFGTRTGIYLDGVYIGEPMSSDAVLVNLERVEVLRGPQGYLYGQNTVSGAVNLVTHAPSNAVDARLSASYGNKDHKKFVGMVNIPIVNDKVLLRVGGAYEDRDGFIYNATLKKHVDDLKTFGGRAQLRLLPTDKLTIDVSADYSSQLSHKVNGEARTNTFNTGLPAAPADQPFVVDDNYPDRDYNRNWGAAMTINYDLGATSFTSITAYRNSYRNWNVDLDHSALDLAYFNYYDRYNTKSQEFRFANSGNRKVHYVFGLFYMRTSASNDRQVTYSTLAPAIGIPADSRIRTNPSINNNSYAVFGAVDWEFLPRLTLNTGLRYTYEEKILRIDQQSDIGLPLSDIAVVSGYRNSYAERSLSPTVGLTWKPLPSATLYAKYARGYKSGGFNADYLTTTQLGSDIRLGREKVDSYEAGIKFQTRDRRLTLSADGFYAEYSNYQVSQFRIIPDVTPPQIELALTNAGKVVTYGPEVSLLLAPIAGLSIDLSAAWLHAVYKSFPNGGGLGIDYSGNRLEYAPKVTASATLDYSHPIGAAYTGFGRMTVSYHGDQYSDSSNAPEFHQKAYTLVNGRIGVRTANDRWEIAVYGENILNKLYDLGTAPDSFTTIFGRYGQPRTYGIELTWHM